MAAAPVNLDALAAKYGGSADSGTPDVDALAKKYGGAAAHWSDQLGLQNPVARGVVDAAEGAKAGLASTILHGGDMIRQLTGTPRVINTPDAQAAMAAPDSTAGKLGKFGEQATEFMLPAAGMADALKGAPLAARAIGQAAVGGAVSAAQSGGNPVQTAVGAALGPAGELAGPAASKLAPGAVKVVSQLLGKTTGAGAEAIEQAIKNPSPALVDAMRGKTSEMEVLNNFKSALQNVRDARSTNYQQQLSQLPGNIQLDITPVENTLNTMLGKFGVKQGANGLDFSRSTLDKPAQAEVQNVVDDVKGWGAQPGDLTPLGVDTLKRRIGNMFSMNSDSRALIQSVKGATDNVLKTNVKGYAEMTGDYASASKFLDATKDLSVDAKNPGTAIRKITTMLRQNNDYRSALTDALSQFSSVDLKGQIAGMGLNKSFPHGITGALETGGALLAGIHEGIIPAHAAVAAAAASPRIMGELLVAMSKASKAAAPAARAVAPAAKIAAPGLANAGVTASQ